MERISAFIVDKRKAFYLMYIGVAIFCVFSSSWVSVNDDLTSYLPDDTETRQGLTAMEAAFDLPNAPELPDMPQLPEFNWDAVDFVKVRGDLQAISGALKPAGMVCGRSSICPAPARI